MILEHSVSFHLCEGSTFAVCNKRKKAEWGLNWFKVQPLRFAVRSHVINMLSVTVLTLWVAPP